MIKIYIYVYIYIPDYWLINLLINIFNSKALRQPDRCRSLCHTGPHNYRMLRGHHLHHLEQVDSAVGDAVGRRRRRGRSADAVASWSSLGVLSTIWYDALSLISTIRRIVGSCADCQVHFVIEQLLDLLAFTSRTPPASIAPDAVQLKSDILEVFESEMHPDIFYMTAILHASVGFYSTAAM